MDSGEPASGGQIPVLRLIVDVAAPIGLYYGLRALGVEVYLALVVGAVVPALIAVAGIIRRRRLDALAAFVATMMLLGVGVSLLTGSTRFLLAKDGWLTGVSGGWFLASLWARQPMAFHGARPLMEGRFGSSGRSWDTLWDREPQFRRIWRVSTVIWGVALLLDAALRIMMAYTLPADLVPGLSGAVWLVTIVLLQLVNGVYYWHAGLWPLLRETPQGGQVPSRAEGTGGPLRT